MTATATATAAVEGIRQQIARFFVGCDFDMDKATAACAEVYAEIARHDGHGDAKAAALAAEITRVGREWAAELAAAR